MCVRDLPDVAYCVQLNAFCRSHKNSKPHKRHVAKLVDAILAQRTRVLNDVQQVNEPYRHADGTVVNEDDPAWLLALAEVAKDHHRIVTNEQLAAVAAAGEANADPMPSPDVLNADDVADGDSSDEEDDDDAGQMTAAAQVAFENAQLLQAGGDNYDEFSL